MRKISLITILIMICISLYAQRDLRRLSPGLTAEKDGKKISMKIENLDVKIKIRGAVAETELNFTFYNPANRVLEGELTIPLPEGSFVNSYALDINGKMVDGVVVEKKRARVIFEKIVRQGIDPGLGEMVEGNSFRTRVYPLIPKKTRKVRVSYISSVKQVQKNLCLSLPVNIKDSVKKFSLEIKVSDLKNKPLLTEGNPGEFTFKNMDTGYYGKKEIRNYIPGDSLKIEIPGNIKTIKSLESDRRGNTFFNITALLKSDSVPAEKISDNIVILWDSSGSSASSNLRKKVELIKNFFNKYKSHAFEVRVKKFNIHTEDMKNFRVLNGDTSEIESYLKKTEYDGASSVTDALNRAWKDNPGLILLFSDGLSNFDIDALIKPLTPVFCFTASNSANFHFLKYIAKISGGTFHDLNSEIISEIKFIPSEQEYSYLKSEVISGEIKEIFPSVRTPVRGPLNITGKLISEKAVIKLNFGFNNKVIKSLKFTLLKSDVNSGSILKTFWAQQKINELMIQPDKNRKELIRTGKKYSIVTPGTSLIVLDSLHQYIAHKVPPPRTLPEMYQKYLIHMRNLKKKSIDERAKKIEEIVKLWNKKIKWWEKKFKLPLPLNIKFPILKPERSKSIFGLVYSGPDSPLPGVQIQIRKSGSSFIKKCRTDADGYYIIPDLPSGTYTVHAHTPGFTQSEKSNVNITDNSLQVNFNIMPIPGMRSMKTRPRTSTPLTEHCIEGGVDGGIVGGVLGGVSSTNEESERQLRVRRPLAKKSKKVKSIAQKSASIKIKAWTPDTPYLKALEKATEREREAVYFKEKTTYGDAPSFYLDCSDFFFKNKMYKTGIRVLSNVAELDLENPRLLRILAYRMEEKRIYNYSEMLFRKVLELRSEEPQSLRDLALLLGKRARYREAVRLLYKTVELRWDRFREIELVCLMEMNNFIKKAKERGIKKFKNTDKRLIKMPDTDIRIVLTWDTDSTDMDLWVIEPTGEKVFYSNRNSIIGGTISRDFTGGYGPEEYLIRRALKGNYTIKVNYYGSRSAKILGQITLKIDIFTNYGRKNEKQRTIIRRLKKKKEIVEAGKIRFE